MRTISIQKLNLQKGHLYNISVVNRSKVITKARNIILSKEELQTLASQIKDILSPKQKKEPKLNDYIIYIPEEGHWNIPGKHKNLTQARISYLKWANRKRLPAGSSIHRSLVSPTQLPKNKNNEIHN